MRKIGSKSPLVWWEQGCSLDVDTPPGFDSTNSTAGSLSAFLQVPWSTKGAPTAKKWLLAKIMFDYGMHLAAQRQLSDLGKLVYRVI